MKIELRQLRYFIAVAEELNFRRAAERLFITQPTLSHQIASLEDTLHVELLERDKRHVALTEAGAVFLDGARQLLRDADRLIEETKRAGGAEDERLLIGYVEYINFVFVARVMQTLREQFPNACIERREMYPTQQVEALLRREIDVGIAILPIVHPELMVGQILVEGHWTLVVPETHRLAEQETIDLTDLADEPLMIFARHLNPPLHDDLLGCFRQAGVEPTIVYQVAQSLYGKSLVREGIGLFIVASYVLPDLDQGLVARRLTGFENHIQFAPIYRQDNRAAVVRAFIEQLRAS